MYDFVIGLAIGSLLTRLFRKKNKKDESTQVDFVTVTTVPIPIPRKSFVSGALANFWGKDS
jgi:hypothetical protein